VIVRVIAVLLALGMLAISVQSTDVAPATDASALIDDAPVAADTLPPYEIVEPAVLAPREASLVAPPPAPLVPAGHRHELSVFRPPRASAFV
jgi:hypothetical protein